MFESSKRERFQEALERLESVRPSKKRTIALARFEFLNEELKKESSSLSGDEIKLARECLATVAFDKVSQPNRLKYCRHVLANIYQV